MPANKTPRIRNQKKSLSSRQKGDIIENRAVEIITLSSKGTLTCYIPCSDDDGIDIIVNPKGEFRPIFVQVKGRYNLQKNGQFSHDVQRSTFVSSKYFYILFIYFNNIDYEVEKLWLVPSSVLQRKAIKIKGGKKHKPTYRFSSSPKGTQSIWAKYSVEKLAFGKKLQEYIKTAYSK